MNPPNEPPDDEIEVMANARPEMSDDAWDALLDRVADGGVVPVVGSQLLAGPAGHGSFSALVAARLLSKLSPATDTNRLSPGHELDDAVALLQRARDVGPSRLYEAVYQAIKHVTREDAAIPLALRQLASISGFRLMVTVTPDDMLARCLSQRVRVNEFVARSAYDQTSPPNPLAAGWISNPGVVHLLYLFGKAKPTPAFAIHEEDVLEYAHDFLAGRAIPVELRDELNGRSTMFIGCRFPDWLSRLFLRATSNGRLSGLREKRHWMVERLQPGESLTLFLNNFSKDTVVLSQLEPSAFVGELHRRWQLHQALVNVPAPPRHEGAPSPHTLFFVSYSRATDLPRAEALCQALLSLGVRNHEIWFDRSTLEPGVDFQQNIADGIAKCEYFLPLLSTGAVAREEAFVLSEWRRANRRLSTMGRRFVMPLIVDSDYEPERFITPDRDVPDWPVREWPALDFGHAPEGRPDGRTLQALKGWLRQASGRRRAP
jgi:TIR domain